MAKAGLSLFVLYTVIFGLGSSGSTWLAGGPVAPLHPDNLSLPNAPGKSAARFSYWIAHASPHSVAGKPVREVAYDGCRDLVFDDRTSAFLDRWTVADMSVHTALSLW